MAMKPRLLLLLLLIASVLCNPLLFSVDRPATAAAANPLEFFWKGFANPAKTKYLKLLKEIRNVYKPANLQHELQLCKFMVYQYETQKNYAPEPAVVMLKGLEIYMNQRKLPLPFVKLCIKTVKAHLQEFNEKKHP